MIIHNQDFFSLSLWKTLWIVWKTQPHQQLFPGISQIFTLSATAFSTAWRWLRNAIATVLRKQKQKITTPFFLPKKFANSRNAFFSAGALRPRRLNFL